jgi:hypothetical protein
VKALTRLLSFVPIVFLALLLALPSVAAAQGPAKEVGVLVGVREDITLDATSSASAVVGVQSQVAISGHAKVVVVVDGTVTLTGPAASVDNMVAIKSSVILGPGTTVGSIRALDSTVTRDPTATVTEVQDLQGSIFVLVGILGTFLLLLWLGWAVAVLVAGAFVAAMAADQTRRMARSVSNEPLKVLGAGLVGLFVSIIVGAVLFVTVIGIPLGVLVFMILGLAAFVGYLVMGVWLGDLLLRRGRSPNEGRPIGSALLGLFLLLIASVIPLVSFFVGWFGLGTVMLNAWRSFTGRGGQAPGGYATDTGWGGQQPGWASPPTTQTSWTPPPVPAGPPPGWGAPQAGAPGQQPPQGWVQPQPPAPPAPPPPAGPPPGWGQPPEQGR